jgi:hypothetical protein
MITTSWNAVAYLGLSTDTKPIMPSVTVGSTFYETDTTNGFIYDGSVWNPL